MKKKAIAMILLLCITLLSVIVYGQTKDEADIYGKITKIVFAKPGKLKEITVENIEEEKEPYDKAIALITENTKILNGNTEIGELVEGQIVSIVFKEGPMLMIYPPRIEAELIKVVENPAKPQIRVPVDLEIEQNEQKKVDAGHSPWKLDPAYVAQVFVSLKISPAGITGEYPIPAQDLQVAHSTDHETIVEVKGDKTAITRVYLKRLIKQGPTGVWTVVGYDSKEDQQKVILEEYELLVEQGSEVSKVREFLDQNIASLSRENASLVLDQFEELQKDFLPQLDEKFYGEKIQSLLHDIYKPGFDLNNLDNVLDQELKNLLLETRDSGYKIETAEGMYFPIIDYEAYKQYSFAATADLKEYIELMADESNKVPAKDAALVISWEEVLKRAINLEKFLNKYPDSSKIKDVQQVYQKYVVFTLFGLNNTPLFAYDSKAVVEDAQSVYLKAAKSDIDSQFLAILRGFLDLLEETNYKLTDKIDMYRKVFTRDILSAYDYGYFTQEELTRALQKDINILKAESHIQQIEESNYGNSTATTTVFKVTDSEVQFAAVPVVFSGNYQGHFTPEKSYPYYTDAAMGGQRGICIKDNFGVWHSFGYRVPISQ